MQRTSFLALALVPLLACSSGGGGGDNGGGGGGGGGAPDPGPASGGGGASTQVGSLIAKGGPSLGSGASGARGGGVGLWSIDASPVVLKATPGLPAKPVWTRPPIALGANPRTFSGTSTYTGTGAVKGDDGTNPATSLWVKAGATVKVEPPAGLGAVLVNGPIVIEGTLSLGRAAEGTLNSASVFVAGTVVALAPTGKIIAAGGDGGAGAGGDGGHVGLGGTEGVFAFGSIDASGGAGGTTGGAGGSVTIGVGFVPITGVPAPTGGTVVLTGQVTVAGGAGGTGAGGAAGDVLFGYPSGSGGGGGVFRAPADGSAARAARATYPDDLEAHLYGTVHANGGGGSAGGSGGRIFASGANRTVVAASLDVSGGTGGGFGQGGDGGEIALGGAGGEVWVEGSCVARGGDSGASLGARGGRVMVAWDDSTSLTVGPIHLSATVDARGGGGDRGGPGGNVFLEATGAVTAVVDGVELDGSGGVGAGAGGAGGELDVYSTEGVVYGPITLGVPVHAKGGSTANQDGAGGTGGVGGHAVVEGSTISLAAMVLDGGSAGAGFAGGQGGGVNATGHGGTTTATAPISVKGGAGTPAGVVGNVILDGVAKPLVNGVYTP